MDGGGGAAAAEDEDDELASMEEKWAAATTTTRDLELRPTNRSCYLAATASAAEGFSLQDGRFSLVATWGSEPSARAAEELRSRRP
nr:unnamed protein product [Digitaria exilis]